MIAKHPFARLKPLVPVVVPIVVSKPTVVEPKRDDAANKFVEVAVVEKSEFALNAVEEAYGNWLAFIVSYATNAVAVVVPPTSSIVVGFELPTPTFPSALM